MIILRGNIKEIIMRIRREKKMQKMVTKSSKKKWKKSKKMRMMKMKILEMLFKVKCHQTQIIVILIHSIMVTTAKAWRTIPFLNFNLRETLKMGYLVSKQDSITFRIVQLKTQAIALEATAVTKKCKVKLNGKTEEW